jgi:hypothetical protein
MSENDNTLMVAEILSAYASTTPSGRKATTNAAAVFETKEPGNAGLPSR